MVEVAGFPRPLYPPDANGYPASSNGPDVEAYKRTIARAGRWPWQNFDQVYSNGFAHGTSGNVGQSGVAGVQRQQHLDATGYIGRSTFNTLRSIRVPEGFPHAGEMAMDSLAASLIDEAYELFEGHEPAPPPQGSTRQTALAYATGELGTKESPAESNLQKYGEWYGSNGVPWCAIFTTWAYVLAGDNKTFAKGSSYAYVPYIVADARANRAGLSTTDSPIPGDLVCYDWEWNGEYDHIGLFEAWSSPGSFTAIEGNTSESDNSNGGEVMRRTRSTSGQATVFVRVA